MHTTDLARAIADHAPDCIVLVDADLQIEYANRPPPWMQGLAVGLPVGAGLSTRARRRLETALGSVFAGCEPQLHELELGPAGDERFIETRFARVPREGDRPLAMLVLRDVTAQRGDACAIRRDRRLLEVMERINTIFFEADTLERVLRGVLDAMLDIFECDRAWLLYPCDPEAMHYHISMECTRPEWPGVGELGPAMPLDPPARRIFERVLATHRSCRYDPEDSPVPDDADILQHYQVRSLLAMQVRPRGETPFCLGIHHCRAPRIYAQDQALFEAIGARIADVLTSYATQRALRASEERFRTMFEHAPDAIVLFDLDTGRFSDANPNAIELFGLPHAELLEREPTDLSPEYQPDGRPSREASTAYLEQARAGLTPVFEWLHTNVHGEEIPCEVRLVRMPHSRKLIRGSIIDIRARKRAEEERDRLSAQLQQSQKMQSLGQLTGGVAHDFNNLLTVIRGNLELAESELRTSDAVRSLIQSSRQAADRASSLTRRLLAFSRKQVLKPETTDVRELLQGMIELTRRTLGEGIAIELACEPGLWACRVDRGQLEHAILNLALNARDAMPGGGRLRLEASNLAVGEGTTSAGQPFAAGEYVRVAVTDDGIGIPEEAQAHVFEPFFTTKGPGRGSGLGLSMVYGFVEQSGGFVTLRSSAGRGTAVELHLPRASGRLSRRPNAARMPRSALAPRGRVLLVEDNAAVRDMTARMLQHLGYHTTPAEDARRALAVLRSGFEIDVLLTDVVLSDGANGVQLAAEAARLRPTLRVLYMSGYTEDLIQGSAASHPLLCKPFTQHKLDEQLRDLLAKPPLVSA